MIAWSERIIHFFFLPHSVLYLFGLCILLLNRVKTHHIWYYTETFYYFAMIKNPTLLSLHPVYYQYESSCVQAADKPHTFMYVHKTKMKLISVDVFTAHCKYYLYTWQPPLHTWCAMLLCGIVYRVSKFHLYLHLWHKSHLSFQPKVVMSKS